MAEDFSKKDWFNETCVKAVLRYGARHQMRMCVEECAELVNALCKYARYRCGEDEVATEIADVIIMCRQMCLIFGLGKVNKEIRKKLERLEKRMSEDGGCP